jgi:hypothetical protein
VRSPIADTWDPSLWIGQLNQPVLFSEGLTQAQESSANGGYDVSINVTNPNGTIRRLLFLQFKSGRHRNHTLKNAGSHFHISKGNGTHIEFKFNDAAYGCQHVILRNLSVKPGIQANSVLYVFPRITEYSDFVRKIGDLIWHSSFVPVRDIDRQGGAQNPPVIISPYEPHKYRISYDGLRHEMNLLLLLLEYNPNPLYEMVAELICIQVERLLKLLPITATQNAIELLSSISEAVLQSLNPENDNDPILAITIKYIEEYLNQIRAEAYQHIPPGKLHIPSAPANYTTALEENVLNIRFDEYTNLESVNFQVF